MYILTLPKRRCNKMLKSLLAAAQNRANITRNVAQLM